MMTRSRRRNLTRGLGAAAVAAMTATAAVAATGPADVENRPDEVQDVAAAQDDDVQDEDAEEADDLEESESDTSDDLAASDTSDDLDENDAKPEEDADLDSEGERSATADAVHEVIDSTPPEERDRDFGQAVAEAARGSAAPDEQPEPAREDG